ncbi:PCI domain-containing protein 2 [Halotydeus destructor]|nr:PCI domain-containing protein 2 [Halotydeus destructor]
MDLEHYLESVRKAVTFRNGREFASLVSYQHRDHSSSRALLDRLAEQSLHHRVSSKVPTPWEDLVTSHIRCCKMLYHENYQAASKEQQNSMQILTKIFQGIKDDIWPLAVVFVTGRDLRLLAIAADKDAYYRGTDSGKPNEHVEKAAELLMGLFRVCATDIRTAAENSKRKAMMNIINQLFKIYFKINKLHLCKPLIRALENANMMDHFVKADCVTYNYFLGMKSMYDSDYAKAEELLEYSFLNCYGQSRKNKRLILTFLIPVKMLRGKIPKMAALEKYHLTEFAPLIRAVKEGNLRAFDEALEAEADLFWTYGIYLILEKLRIICYRNVFKKVCLIMKTHQIPVTAFKTALDYLQGQPIELEEVHCILANLIYENRIKGYISLQYQKLVISKQNPFPSLAA